MANFVAKPATKQLAIDALMRDEDAAKARTDEINAFYGDKNKKESVTLYKQGKRRLAKVILDA